MRFFLPILLSLLIANVLSQCLSNLGDRDESCGNDNQCKRNLVCYESGSGRTCNLAVEYQNCTGNQYCGSPFPLCLNYDDGIRKCSARRDTGSLCTHNVECASNNCLNGRCAGFQYGMLCTAGTCAEGLYCNGPTNTATCHRQFKAGEICDESGVNENAPNYPRICQPGFYCDVRNHQCTRYLSIALNGLCSSSSGCQKGLYCNGRNQCAPISNHVGIACTAQGQCSTFGDCCDNVCTSYFNEECDPTDYFDCLEAFGCHYIDGSARITGSCANEHCACEAAKLEECRNAGVNSNLTVPISSFPECNSATTLWTFSSLLWLLSCICAIQ